MKKVFELPDDIIKQIGDEWRGTYTAKLLMADEYMRITEELVAKLRDKEGWNGLIPPTAIHEAIIYAACQKDGAPLPKNLPAKLYEILVTVAVGMNTLSQAEEKALLLSFRVE